MRKTKDQLIEAAQSGSVETVERLLKLADCDPGVRDYHGRSALMWAAMNGRDDCVKLLLPVNDPLAKNNNGLTALMLAAMNGHESCVRVLLPVNDPLAKDNIGYTALMLAAVSGYKDCVRLLLPGSDALALSHDGRSASQLARDSRYPEVAGMIDAYILARSEAALLSTDTLPAPPRRAPVIRI